MIDLRQQDLFTWTLLKASLHGHAKNDKIALVVTYMNKYFAYLTGISTQTPIVCKVYSHEEEKCDIMYITLRDFIQTMQNKAIKIRGKFVNIATIWLKHERRQEYNGVIYSPKPLGPLEKNYLNTFLGFKFDPPPDPSPYANPEGDERGKAGLRVYLQHLHRVCGNPRYSLLDTRP